MYETAYGQFQSAPGTNHHYCFKAFVLEFRFQRPLGCRRFTLVFTYYYHCASLDILKISNWMVGRLTDLLDLTVVQL